MIRLQSNERFNDLAELDEITGVWRLACRAAGDKEYGDGFFSILAGVFCTLFRSNGELFVRIGEIQVELTNDIEITVDGPPEKRCFSLLAGGKQLARLIYSVESKRIEHDPTPFIEEEDFDFGLWLSNIAKNPNRQAVLKGEA